MRARRTLSPVHWLVVVTMAVVTSFLGANLYSQAQARRIDAAASTMVMSAVPSIHQVSVARGHLLSVQLALGAEMRRAADGRPPELSDGEEALARLDEALAACARLPPYPGKRALYELALRDVATFEVAVRSAGEALTAGDLPRARRIVSEQVASAAERSDGELEGLVDLSSQHLRDLALTVGRARSRSSNISYGLHALAAITALALLAIAVPAARQYSRMVEERKRLAEHRASELEQFAGRVAHDLKGPLGTLKLRVQLAASHLADTPHATEDLRRATAQTARMAAIIDGLLDFARAGGRPDRAARSSVGDVIAGVVTDARAEVEAVSAKLRIELDEDLHVACSPAALSSIVSNLLRNAVKYIVEGTARERQIAVRARRGPSGRVRVEVEDNGPGLPPGQEEAIFDPFVRGAGTSQPGVGLGLATVKRLAEAYGGSVRVASRPGEGACFVVELRDGRAASADAGASRAG